MADLLVEIPTAETRADPVRRGKPFTVYLIYVTSSMGELTLYRRYSEFYNLYQTLKRKKVPSLPDSFPSKKAWGSLNPKTVEKRRVGLQTFLRQLLALPDIIIKSYEVRKFLELSRLVPQSEQTAHITHDMSGLGAREETFPAAVALFDFAGMDDTDLAFTEGDIITVHDTEDPSGWWSGELDGRFGIFPFNYVRILEEGEDPQEASAAVIEAASLMGPGAPGWESGSGVSEAPTSTATATSTADPASVDSYRTTTTELPSVRRAGPGTEELELLSPGRPAPPTPPVLLHDERMSRHSMHLERLETNRDSGYIERWEGDIEEHDEGDFPRVRALFPYVGADETDLNFDEGDIITVLEVDDESGWWFGKVGTEIGLFPSNFVESIVGK